MNQIVPKVVNMSELVQNSKTTLSLTFQSKMIHHLNKEFSEREQQWYIANLYMYLNYHPTNDYPINLDNVYGLLGFANKGNAMKAIKNNFVKNEDYKITLFHTEKRKNEGGFNKENVMLNTDTFKTLCMLVKTDKGKEIRKYYVKLENIYNNLIKEELEQNSKILEEKDKLLTETERELDKTKKELEKSSKLKTKKWYDCEPGHTVYGFISNEMESNSLITIGKSKNIKKRESDYMTHNQTGRMFYIRKCYNCDLTEKVLQHILDKYRCKRAQEWFDISEELATYVIDLVCDFLDTFIGCSEKLPDYKLGEFIRNFQLEGVDYKVVFEEDTPIQERIPDIIINDDIKNYTKFLSDCCEVGDEYYSLPSEITAAYRIWCKGGMTRVIRTELGDYIKGKFPKKDMYMENLGVRSVVLAGIRPKELIFKPIDTNNLTLFEEFCIDQCVTNYSYKIKMDDLVDSYKQWLQRRGEDWNEDNLQGIKARLSKQFLVEYYSSVCYIWGLQLKTTPLPTYHSRSTVCNKIYQIDFQTKETMAVLRSLSEASHKFSLLPEILSHKIRYKKPFAFDGKMILLVYDKPNLEHVGVKRAVNHKPIYKFDLDSKKVVESYKTIAEAAAKNDISSRTIAKYLKMHQIFNTKKDGAVQLVLTYSDTIDDDTARKIKQQQSQKKDSGVVRVRPRKRIVKVDCETNKVVDTFYGILEAATKMGIGECTVSRHLKSGKKLKIRQDNTFVILKYSKDE